MEVCGVSDDRDDRIKSFGSCILNLSQGHLTLLAPGWGGGGGVPQGYYFCRELLNGK